MKTIVLNKVFFAMSIFFIGLFLYRDFTIEGLLAIVWTVLGSFHVMLAYLFTDLEKSKNVVNKAHYIITKTHEKMDTNPFAKQLMLDLVNDR